MSHGEPPASDPSESTIDRHETPTLPPYRVVRRAGSGGMGEVFLAQDDRLGRKVAIKCLRPDRQATVASRERLRREARFVARLNHPAIVQVHDVLERDGADYLVMEWVDGEDLRKLSRREGPLPIERIVALARQLAGGLAEAHRRGVVHRDLKAENILVDSHGRAKITDFGIAKRMPGGSGSSVALDDALTADEVVLGTYRSMSPEQALAEPVGPRSDLFSLGVLLYELLAGRSPFEGTSALDTLRRVVELEPESVEQFRPDTPPALAELVGQLLAKDPNRRPRGAAEVERTLALLDTSDDTLTTGTPRPSAIGRPFATHRRLHQVAIMGIAIVLLTAAALLVGRVLVDRDASTETPPLYVATLSPDVRLDDDVGTDDGGLTTFAEAVRVAMVRGLIALDGVSAKATAEIDRVDGTPLDIAASVGADEILSATVVYRPASARVSIGRLRVADGVVTTSTAFDVPTDDLLLVVRAVSAQVRGLYPTQSVRPGTPGLDVGPAALRRFIELRRTFLLREDVVGDDLLQAITALRDDAPDLFDLDLLEAQVALYRFHDSRDPDHLERARHAVDRARAKAPDDPRTLRQAFELERRAGRLDVARTLLDRLAEVQTGDVQLLDLRARLLQSEGQAVDALTLQREAVERQPSLDRLIDVARSEMAIGEIDAARVHLQDALRRSPEFFEAMSLLAELELGTGDPAVAAGLYQQLVDRGAGTSELSNLGVALMLLGQYRSASTWFEQAFDREPLNPFFALNLADSLYLAGDAEAAQALYSQVVELVGEDPAVQGAQFLTVQAQALAHLGRSRDAVSVLQRALQSAPDHAAVVYEAALVYSLIGERTSALVHAEAALDRGVDRRWFDFPWFDELRRDATFSARLDRPGT